MSELQIAMRVEKGWLGLEELPTDDNWQLRMQIGDHVARVRVLPNSPAKSVGMMTGDYVVSVNGRPFAEFEAAPPAAGAIAIIEVFRAPHGRMLFDPVLIARPAELKRTRPLQGPQVACGEPVERKHRLRWCNEISVHPALTIADKALASLIALRYLSRAGTAFPAHATLARDLNVAARTIKRSIARLHHCGLLQISSGKRRGRSNTYSLSWPLRAGSNVAYLPRAGPNVG